MSYYTQRHIVASDDFKFTEEIMDKYFSDEELSLMSDNCIRGNVQWRTDMDDMRRFSADYPAVLFTMTCEGEEMDDLWRVYFKGGKAQIVSVIITYPEYDEAKLE